jgi:hypothetical protein
MAGALSHGYTEFMSIVVFWLSAGHPFVETFSDEQLLPALAFAEARRKDKDAQGLPLNHHVVLSSELGDHVGQAGVSDERPADYSWTKSHRGGPPEPGTPPKTLA